MLFLVILSAVQILYVSGACPGGWCDRTLVYEDLRCKPIYQQETDCCPTRYDCSHIEQDAQIKGGCHYHGRLYKPGEKLDGAEIYANCQVGCTCREHPDGKFGFTCAVLDCPEWLGVHPPPTCHLKYELNKCCSSGKVCPPFNHTCNAGGKTYNEGERFEHPHEKCTSCVCREGFNFGECAKKTCTEEIHNREDIENFCAPSYREDDHCCPWSWICPEETDVFVMKKIAVPHPDLKCKFGKRDLSIGDSLDRVDQKYGGTVSCKCLTPPLLTCIHHFETVASPTPGFTITKIKS